MQTHVPANDQLQKKSPHAAQLTPAVPAQQGVQDMEQVALRTKQAMMSASPRVQQLQSLQTMTDQSAVAAVQRRADDAQSHVRGPVVQMQFIDPDSKDAYFQAHGKAISVANPIVITLLGQYPNKLGWMENLPPDLKKLVLYQLVIEPGNPSLLQRLCFALIQLPVPIETMQPSTSLIMMLAQTQSIDHGVHQYLSDFQSYFLPTLNSAAKWRQFLVHIDAVKGEGNLFSHAGDIVTVNRTLSLHHLKLHELYGAGKLSSVLSSSKDAKDDPKRVDHQHDLVTTGGGRLRFQHHLNAEVDDYVRKHIPRDNQAKVLGCLLTPQDRLRFFDIVNEKSPPDELMGKALSYAARKADNIRLFANYYTFYKFNNPTGKLSDDIVDTNYATKATAANDTEFGLRKGKAASSATDAVAEIKRLCATLSFESDAAAISHLEKHPLRNRKIDTMEHYIHWARVTLQKGEGNATRNQFDAGWSIGFMYNGHSANAKLMDDGAAFIASFEPQSSAKGASEFASMFDPRPGPAGGASKPLSLKSCIEAARKFCVELKDESSDLKKNEDEGAVGAKFTFVRKGTKAPFELTLKQNDTGDFYDVNDTKDACVIAFDSTVAGELTTRCNFMIARIELILADTELDALSGANYVFKLLEKSGASSKGNRKESLKLFHSALPFDLGSSNVEQMIAVHTEVLQEISGKLDELALPLKNAMPLEILELQKTQDSAALDTRLSQLKAQLAEFRKNVNFNQLDQRVNAAQKEITDAQGSIKKAGGQIRNLEQTLAAKKKKISPDLKDPEHDEPTQAVKIYEQQIEALRKNNAEFEIAVERQEVEKQLASNLKSDFVLPNSKESYGAAMKLHDQVDGQLTEIKKAADAKIKIVRELRARDSSLRQDRENIFKMMTLMEASVIAHQYKGPKTTTDGMEIDTDLTIHHLILPETVSPSDFPSIGVAGGHHEPTLQIFLAHHPEYQFVLEKKVTTLGATMCLYRQYMYTGASPPPINDMSNRPSLTKVPAGWIVCQVRKSTVNDLNGWLAQGVLAFNAWKEFDPQGPASQKVGRGLYKGAKGDQAKTSGGMEFGGRVEFVQSLNKWVITQLVPHVEELEKLTSH